MTSLTLEQRKRQAELIGNRVRGSTRAHLRVDAGAVCLTCSGPLPCTCEPPTDEAPDVSRSAAVVLPDHATAARQRLALVRAQGGPKPRGAASWRSCAHVWTVTCSRLGRAAGLVVDATRAAELGRRDGGASGDVDPRVSSPRRRRKAHHLGASKPVRRRALRVSW
jgi:hypothetical protein